MKKVKLINSVSIISVSAVFYLFGFCLTSCDPDCGTDPIEETFYIKDSCVFDYLPYTGYDTLIFSNDTGDTIIFIGQGVKTTYEGFYENGPEQCNKWIRDYERRNYKYYEDDEAIKERLQVVFKRSSVDSTTNIDLQIWSTVSAWYYLDTHCSDTVDLDSMVINSKTYYDVYLAEKDTNRQIYFTKDEGIIHYKGNGESWYLVNE